MSKKKSQKMSRRWSNNLKMLKREEELLLGKKLKKKHLNRILMNKNKHWMKSKKISLPEQLKLSMTPAMNLILICSLVRKTLLLTNQSKTDACKNHLKMITSSLLRETTKKFITQQEKINSFPKKKLIKISKTNARSKTTQLEISWKSLMKNKDKQTYHRLLILDSLTPTSTLKSYTLHSKFKNQGMICMPQRQSSCSSL